MSLIHTLSTNTTAASKKKGIVQHSTCGSETNTYISVFGVLGRSFQQVCKFSWFLAYCNNWHICIVLAITQEATLQVYKLINHFQEEKSDTCSEIRRSPGKTCFGNTGGEGWLGSAWTSTTKNQVGFSTRPAKTTGILSETRSKVSGKPKTLVFKAQSSTSDEGSRLANQFFFLAASANSNSRGSWTLP